MSRPSTPSKAAATTATATRSHRDDVLQFLDNLDSFDAPTAGSTGPVALNKSINAAGTPKSSSATGASRSAAVAPSSNEATTGSEDPQSVLDFLDEIVTRRGPTATSSSSNIPKKSTTTSNAASAGSISRSGSRGVIRDKSSYLTPRDSTSASPLSTTSATTGTSTAALAAEKLDATPALVPNETGAAGGSWGWGSVWSQASNIVQQARTAAEEQVSKNLPKDLLPTSLSHLPQLPVSPALASAQGAAALSSASEQARQWRTGALSYLSNNLSNLDIDKLRRDITSTGMKALKDVMDTVAPPIAEHEVIQVNLSHDMVGYEGVETLVYRALAKIMEQVEGGDLVVNKGQSEDLPSAEKQSGSSAGNNDDGDERNLNTVEGFVEGYRLAEANIEALIKRNYKETHANDEDAGDEEPQGDKKLSGHERTNSALTVPVTICPVYMRIQPVLAALPFSKPSLSPSNAIPPTTPSSGSEDTSSLLPSEEPYLFFIILLRDPTNQLVHKTLTQSMPSAWLSIPFEENEWVEDIMVEIIRRGVEILGEEYVKGRMTGRLLKNAQNKDADIANFKEDGDVLYENKEESEEEEVRESMEVANAAVGAIP